MCRLCLPQKAMEKSSVVGLCVRKTDDALVKLRWMNLAWIKIEYTLPRFVNTVQYHTEDLVSVLERMVTFAAGTKHIREAIPFPRMLQLYQTVRIGKRHQSFTYVKIVSSIIVYCERTLHLPSRSLK